MNDSAPDIEIYTRSDCNWSFAAKRLLMQRGRTYREFVVDRDPEAARRLHERVGEATLPQVFVDGERVGGFEALQAFDRAGRLG